ncbi:MAG TPA: hypothetical protein VE081_00690, partial [Sporichthyaceae bacterium]|nr:hypothetical protein [Sporichthyaceae bacterium]
MSRQPTPTGRHRRPPPRRRRRRALTVGMACVLASGGVVLLADPVSAATEVRCQPAGQQIQCSTSDSTTSYQFTAPHDLTAQVDVRGADGGSGGVEQTCNDCDRSFLRAQGAGVSGGQGGFTSVLLTLNRGDVLSIYVGGPGASGTSCHGGAGGNSGGIRTGGDGGKAQDDGEGGCTTDTSGGGGGGGATFVLRGNGTATTGTPLAVAGGGGGGAGVGSESPPPVPPVGGKGGGNQSGSQPGQPTPSPGGKSGDQKASGSRVGGNGEDAGCLAYRAASIDSTDTCAYGGGGGGGGLVGGD